MNFSKRSAGEAFKKSTEGTSGKAEPVCKPGSVENDHLSRPAVAGRFKPPPEDGRAGHVSSHGVAPDRVYSVHMSPCDE